VADRPTWVPGWQNRAVDEIAVDERGIRLGQLLKLAGLVDSGSDAKALLATGEVTVNGEPDTRRGRQLQPGDVVRVGTHAVRIA
jgi:ribosome-associated protein